MNFYRLYACIRLYVEKQKNSEQTDLGVGGTVVQELVAQASVPENAECKIYFDNHFTSNLLLTTLADSGICATGTVRENRIPNRSLPAKAAFSKEKKRNCQPCYNRQSLDYQIQGQQCGGHCIQI